MFIYIQLHDTLQSRFVAGGANVHAYLIHQSPIPNGCLINLAIFAWPMLHSPYTLHCGAQSHFPTKFFNLRINSKCLL